ncbi:MAG: hypothetical protein ACI8Z5_002587, partial [Lentimonas sp.]
KTIHLANYISIRPSAPALMASNLPPEPNKLTINPAHSSGNST